MLNILLVFLWLRLHLVAKKIKENYIQVEEIWI